MPPPRDGIKEMIDPATIIGVISVTFQIWQVCWKNRQKAAARCRKPLLIDNIFLGRAVRRAVGREMYFAHGYAIKQALLKVGSTVSEDDIDKLVQAMEK
jgi:hypothetical protein